MTWLTSRYHVTEGSFGMYKCFEVLLQVYWKHPYYLVKIIKFIPRPKYLELSLNCWCMMVPSDKARPLFCLLVLISTTNVKAEGLNYWNPNTVVSMQAKDQTCLVPGDMEVCQAAQLNGESIDYFHVCPSDGKCYKILPVAIQLACWCHAAVVV